MRSISDDVLPPLREGRQHFHPDVAMLRVSPATYRGVAPATIAYGFCRVLVRAR